MPHPSMMQYQVHVDPIVLTGETVFEDKWHFPWSTPVWSKKIHPARMGGEFNLLGSDTGEIVFEDKWHFAWSEPIVKAKVGLRTGAQQTLAFQPTPIIDIGWFAELSKPQKLEKVGLRSSLQQALAFQPTPIIDISWFNELSKPRTLQKRGIRPDEQQTLTFNPQPFVSFGWFDNLSDPVRIKPGLKASLQQFLAADTAAIPISKLIAWFDWLSDPVRTKPGLKASLQQFLAAPPRLLPTPTSFGVLDATETKDRFLAGTVVFNRPVDGELGVQELDRAGETGVSMQAAPITARMSIRTQ